MNEQILINVTPFETRVAIVEQGTAQEIQLERSNQRGIVGNIYLGKVARVLPGMQSAFIDIGLERAAFIHLANLRENRESRQSDNVQVQIEKVLFEGQTLLVQVIKDAIGTKGARVSNQISIAGRSLVYLPHDPHIGISQKIDSEEEREKLRQRVQNLIHPTKKAAILLEPKLVGRPMKN
ncbi:ribonuclease G [Oligella ureolytica]